MAVAVTTTVLGRPLTGVMAASSRLWALPPGPGTVWTGAVPCLTPARVSADQRRPAAESNRAASGCSRRRPPGQQVRERVTGLEPASSAWKAEALPLDDTRRNRKECRPSFQARPSCSDADGRSRRRESNSVLRLTEAAHFRSCFVGKQWRRRGSNSSDRACRAQLCPSSFPISRCPCQELNPAHRDS